MPISLAERLTARFYDWERNGRGWRVYNFPVDLEPPFVPFFFHAVEPVPYIDDGKKPTILSRLAELFNDKGTTAPTVETTIETETQELEPYPFTDESSLKAITVSIP